MVVEELDTRDVLDEAPDVDFDFDGRAGGCGDRLTYGEYHKFARGEIYDRWDGEETRWYCTREKGHEGYCYAGVGEGIACARWLRIREGEW